MSVVISDRREHTVFVNVFRCVDLDIGMFLAEGLVLIIFQSAEEGIVQHVMTIDNRHSIGRL